MKKYALFIVLAICSCYSYGQTARKLAGFDATTGRPGLILPDTTLNFPFAVGKYLTGYRTFGSLADTVRAAISLTTTGTSGPATYNSSTGVLNVPQYTAGGGGTVTGGSITWPGTIYSTPTTGSVGSGTLTFAPALASQSAYTLFGRGSGSGTPSFLSSIDSNWIPALHSQTYYDLRYAAIGGSSYTFSTGATNTGGTITINLSTGKTPKQFAYGGTVAGDTLGLRGTTTGKGTIIFGDALYDETNSQLRLLAASAVYTLPRGLFFYDTTAGGTQNRLASLQSLNSGSNSFVLLAANKYYNGSAWVDNGLSRVGGALQIQNNILQFLQFNTGTTQTQRFGITAGGLVTVGDYVSTGLTASATFEVRSAIANSVRIGHTAGDQYSYLFGRGGTVGYFLSSPDPANTTPGFQILNAPFSVGNTTETTIAPSAIAEFNSTTKGVLMPRMTATQASAISSPADGLMIYVTNTNGTFTALGFWGRENGVWIKL